MKHTKRCRGRVERARIIVTAPDVGLAMAWRTCATCGTWLPLGSSDEMPVAVEVRAAEIASRPFDSGDMDGAEICGWMIRSHDSNKIPEQPGEHAGYLAHAIAHHDEEQAAGQALSDGGTTEGAWAIART